MIFCSVTLAVIFLVIFIVNAKNGQFEDDESPAVRMLLDSEIIKEEDTDQEENSKKNREEKSD